MLFKQLFTPIKIGHLEVKNRLVMAPMETNLADATGAVTQALIDFVEARAKGGVGLIVTEMTMVDPVAKYTVNGLGAFDDRLIPGWRALAQAVHRHGAKIFAQLIHPGPIAAFALSGIQPVGPSAIASPMLREIPRELSIDEIPAIAEEFGEAARRLKEAGCDGVEVHMAHGGHCLVAAFTSRKYNKRTDAYGGSLDGRLKFALEVIRNIRAKSGDDFVITVRLSGDEFVADGRSIEETQYMVHRLEEAGAMAIHVSSGAYPGLAWRVLPPIGTPLGLNAAQASAVRETAEVPVMAVGRIKNPMIAEHILETGKADLVVMGRALLADPELPNKAAAGQFDDIAPCIGCGWCLAEIVTKPVTCMMNPAVGKEKEMEIIPARDPKKVVVVGAGPGGLEAARVAALRGHEVILLEKTERIGGQLYLGSIAPAKQEICEGLKYLRAQVQKAGAKLTLGTEVTPELIAALKPGAVVIATGARRNIPDIPGVDGDKVVTAEDVLLGKVVRGSNVIVLGGGSVGCEVADFLAENGDHFFVGRTAVTIVEMRDEIALEDPPEMRFMLLERLRAKGVRILTGANAKRILPDGVVVVRNGVEEAVCGMDTIVLAMGTRSCNELVETIRQQVAEIHVIGDAKEPRNGLKAIAEGAAVARLI